jgi:hypothetical protein
MKLKFNAKTPHALNIVCAPSIDDVGRSGESFEAAFDKGKVNAIEITQNPELFTT